MSFPMFRAALLAAIALATPALAADIEIHDPYARTSSAMATSGAAFMVIHNHGTTPDRLIGAASPVAEKVELHTHKENAQGVMQMIHVAEGFDLPAGGEILMQRGGHHVMFLGLTAPLNQGDTVPVTLTFEKAGDVVVAVPVDLDRKPDHGTMNHGTMDHGKMDHGKAKTGG